MKKRVVTNRKNENIGIMVWEGYCRILEKFEILESGYNENIEGEIQDANSFDSAVGEFCYDIKDTAISKNAGPKLIEKKFTLGHLQKQLEKFIKIFNLYLELVIDKLEPKSRFTIEADSWPQPDHIFSFNYTNTFRKFYQSETKAEFLHGHLGEEQNIVLGILDLEDESLKKLKAFGFTKYHQKLFKDTDYLLLERQKKKIITDREKLLDLKEKITYNSEQNVKNQFQQNLDKVFKKQMLNLNIQILGHSLDVSDKEYIIDLFSLNDGMDRNVRIIVYYFDNLAKFSLLNNLLAILEKDKIEQWMKNDWLKFKSNPVINFGTQEISTIQEAS